KTQAEACAPSTPSTNDVIHETAAILAAEVAANADAGVRAPETPHDPEMLEEGRRVLMLAPRRQTDEREEMLAEWDRYQRLSQAQARGTSISESDRAWMR